MALVDLQRRLRELGRIRAGEKGPKGEPRRRSEWRLTSASRTLLEAAAVVYGGTVQEWKGAPTEGTQYELSTDTDTLDVVVPPGQTLTQFWEQWSGGGVVRRCTGERSVLDDSPCACPADLEERLELGRKGRACLPVTRLSVILPRIPDIGVWRVETRGVNAAVEVPGTVNLLQSALQAGEMIPAQLRIDQRTSKKNGQTRHFVVPVIELPSITPASLMAGEPLSAPALPDGERRALPPASESKPPAQPRRKAASSKSPSVGDAQRQIAEQKAAPPPLPGEDGFEDFAPAPSAATETTTEAESGEAGATAAAEAPADPPPDFAVPEGRDKGVLYSELPTRVLKARAEAADGFMGRDEARAWCEFRGVAYEGAG